MKISKICITCNESFDADIREHNRGNAKYCSLSCASKNRKIKKSLEKECINCSNKFVTASKETKYCSKSCKQKYYRKQQIIRR